MVSLTPRLSPRLRAEIEQLARRDLTVAEICRRAGLEAERLGVPRASYETVRLVVRGARRWAEPSTASVLMDINMRRRPPDALVKHVAGVGVPKSK